MIVFDDERRSDSPYVERIWRCHGERAGSLISIAESRCELVVTRYRGALSLTVRGPETVATRLGRYPAGGEWLGIRLTPGSSLRPLPARDLVDGAVTLPRLGATSFLLDSSAWEFPDYDNADTFVERLVRADLLVREPVVDDALHGHPGDCSPRTLQRRFRHATGITRSAARQIERARYATLLLRHGAPIPDTTLRAGYFDQPHLTRSLIYYIGQTPGQLQRDESGQQLSFLYKTTPFG